ncbi:MAG TPA: carbamoyltransferase HypF [Solirubrobacteraceae bacterium]
MRVRVRVEGVVQGVGFRPYVYRLARGHGLGGWVLNDERGVELEAEGDADAVRAFLAALPAEAPPLAGVERVDVAELEPRGEATFAIVESAAAGAPAALVAPDTATCADCLRELFDPTDRRYRYAFINCTNCGPRFTIVRGVPYDRPLTTMAGFAMCERCRAEYEDPADRRFHAQPNACPDCGPRLSVPLEEVAAALRAGAIVAVKGVGGYHLACRAGDEAAVAALRARKHREEKPFALMARDLEAARELVALDAEDERRLTSPARPIVIARRRGAAVAPSVAPRTSELGVMLPYSPLHHLLLADAGEPLVMTSGNRSDEPIAYRDDDARERLAGIADLFLSHDRPIETRTEDSVVRGPVFLRRSRGYVPGALRLPVEAARDTLACGAELKSTFCLAKGRTAWVGPHLGDLADYETLRSFREGVAHFERLFAVTPDVVAHDLHPDYLSTAYALEREGVEPVGVQHHHAHLAASLAEHGETGPAAGAIFDGTGYGTDGTVWGGEILRGGLDSCERVAHLWPVPLPGGEAAIRQPWRMACAWLVAAGVEEPAPLPGVDAARWRAVARLPGVTTTSVGRLFDAVAALCGLRTEVTYEGQAAMELEAVCSAGDHGAYPMTGLDPRQAILDIAHDVAAGVPPAVVSARFHAGLARAAANAVAAQGLETAVLSGGAFQNRVLLAATAGHLRAAGLRVLVPRALPPNDGGIAFGQAAVAAARARA